MSDETMSIRVIPFSGTPKGDYHPWKIKTSAIGYKYGWAEALLNDYSHVGVTKTNLTDEVKAEKKLNVKAVTHLVLSCTE
jgi:hypothetical protein